MTGTAQTSSPVSLAERRLLSQRAFGPLYEEGMGLVEEAAAFLDGQGRAEAKKLQRGAAAVYAAESMRLTTRLMNAASWLLVNRAAIRGDMEPARAAAERAKSSLSTPAAPPGTPHLDELPEAFLDLVARSVAFERRIAATERGLQVADCPVMSAAADPVGAMTAMLGEAFGRG